MNQYESTKFDRAVAAALGVLAEGKNLRKESLRDALREPLSNTDASAAIRQARERFADSDASAAVTKATVPSTTVDDPDVREVVAVVQRVLGRARVHEQSRADVLLAHQQRELDDARTRIAGLEEKVRDQTAKTAKAERDLKALRREMRMVKKEATAGISLAKIASQLQKIVVNAGGPSTTDSTM